jgi:hypothetical protein
MNRAKSKLLCLHLLTIGLLCASLLVYIFSETSTNPIGYCNSQKRYISDDEFINASAAALDWQANRIVTKYPENEKVRVKGHFEPYKNLDFDLENENCCLVTRHNKSLDKYNIEVWLNPRTSTSPITPSDSQLRFFFNSCGKLIDSDIGLPNTSIQVITTTSITEGSQLKPYTQPK